MSDTSKYNQELSELSESLNPYYASVENRNLWNEGFIIGYERAINNPIKEDDDDESELYQCRFFKDVSCNLKKTCFTCLSFAEYQSREKCRDLPDNRGGCYKHTSGCEGCPENRFEF